MSDRRRIAARNAGLERVSRLTRWALGGGLVLSGVFSAVAAHSFGGHSTSAVSPSDAAAAPISAPSDSGYRAATQPDPALTTPTTSSRFFARPSTVPLRTPRRARVSSGGS